MILAEHGLDQTGVCLDFIEYVFYVWMHIGQAYIGNDPQQLERVSLFAVLRYIPN